MPVSSTTIHELFKPWVRVEVTMTDGRTAQDPAIDYFLTVMGHTQ